MSRYPGQASYSLVTAALAILVTAMAFAFPGKFNFAMAALAWLSTGGAIWAKDIALFLANPPKINVPLAIYTIATAAMVAAFASVIVWLHFG